jgi:membrane fusion protein, multidrug efflux system
MLQLIFHKLPRDYSRHHSGKGWLCDFSKLIKASGAVFFCMLLVSCDGRDRQKGSQDKSLAIPVEVLALGHGPIESVLKASSNLEAESEVQVPARTANRVQSVLVEEGDRVMKGDLLLQLENDIQTILVSKAENQVQEASEEFKRQESLHNQNLVSDQVYSQSKYQLRQLELNLQDAKRELGYTEIRAPITGTVTQRLAKAGDQVAAGQDLFSIIDFDSIVARLYIPEKDLRHVQVNQQVRVHCSAYPEETFLGGVLRVAPVVQSKSGLVKVTVGFKEVKSLRPGMYVDAEIVTSSKSNALLLPKKAIVYDGEQRFVFRIGDDQTAERLLLEVGLEDPDHVEPSTSFKSGDLVVIAGQTGLKDGSVVRFSAKADSSESDGEQTQSPPPSITKSNRDS